MKHVAEALMIALCVMAMAYCTVETGRNGNQASMQKAQMCVDGGGRYDFTWAKCDYREQP